MALGVARPGDGAAEHAAIFAQEADQLGHEGLVEQEIAAGQRDGLQLDPAGPAGAHLGEDRPGDRVLRRYGIDVGAQQAVPWA